MLETTVNSQKQKTYANLKDAFTAEGCKLFSEHPPEQLVFRQGSLWGISPKTAKKTIKLDFQATETGTRITASAKLASDWKNITLVGCILAAAFTAVCLWLASDLSAFSVTREPGVWSWIVTAGSNVNLKAAAVLVNLTYGLAAFLLAVIGLEAAVVAYVHKKIDVFTQQTLQKAAYR